MAVAVLPEDLAAVGDVAGVEYVGEELTPQFSAVCDTTTSEGDAILHANDLRAPGVDGTGVKVGVLSDSYTNPAALFTTAAADIVSDNLPGAGNTCGHTTVSIVADKPTAGPDEGRGMMQIVHDLAPGAALDFATANVSQANFASHITQLADQGAKVIVDDVTYFAEPMYQDGIIEQAVTGVRARGVDYFTARPTTATSCTARGRLLRGRRRLPRDDLPPRWNPSRPRGLSQLRHRRRAGQHLLLHACEQQPDVPADPGLGRGLERGRQHRPRPLPG